jgi:hypothetical protein
MAGAKCGDRAVRAVYEDHAATAEHDDSGCLDLCDVHHMLFHKAVSERKEVEQRCWYHMSLLSLRLFFAFCFEKYRISPVAVCALNVSDRRRGLQL